MPKGPRAEKASPSKLDNLFAEGSLSLGLRGQKRLDLQRQLERKAVVRVIEIQARDLARTLQPVQERVAVEMEALRRPAHVAVMGEESLEREAELRVVVPVVAHNGPRVWLWNTLSSSVPCRRHKRR